MHSLHRSLFAIIVALSVTVNRPDAVASEPDPQEVAFFENQIRPILVKHCYECHSAESDQLGGNLRLDDREALRQGGESGRLIVEGKPAESLLIKALKYDGVEMPPSEPLPQPVVANFEKWISRGAVDPRRKVTPTDEKAIASATKSDLWSIQPITAPTVPTISDVNWTRHPIDRFVMTKMVAEHVEPTHRADSRTLVRRLFIDLIGLPPTFTELQSWVSRIQNDRQTAVERLVDELLSRPEYGQRWGRHWLDVARYGESNGNDGLGRNPTFPHAWRYRDYVIDAFNADIPYDRFLMEQIAGDLLPVESAEQSDRLKIATGFLAMAAKPAKAMNNNFAMDVVADQIDLIGRGLMGLSVGCARCHDHKFDPVPIHDYYALAGIFTSTETMWGLAGNEKLSAPPTDLHVLKTASKNLPPEDFTEDVILLESATGKAKKIPDPKWEKGTPLAMGVRDANKIADCKVNINGDAKKLGKQVPRGFLSAIQVDSSTDLKPSPSQSGRLELAKWITHPTHPLTARVMVNRIWMHLFGNGLVQTPDDFGVYGERPTHPELLDYLATRFIERNWSIKRLVREIVLSRTYQLSSDANPESIKRDPDSRLLTRHRLRRMDAETIRDSLLAAAGELDLNPAEGSLIQHRDILVNLAGNLHRPSTHRSVYLCYLRSSPPPELSPFNLPDFTRSVGQRETTIVSAQPLFFLNSPFVVEQSNRLAEHIIESASCSQERVVRAYHLILLRDPTAIEAEDAISLVHELESDSTDPVIAWASLCQALFMTNEFRYVD